MQYCIKNIKIYVRWKKKLTQCWWLAPSHLRPKQNCQTAVCLTLPLLPRYIEQGPELPYAAATIPAVRPIPNYTV